MSSSIKPATGRILVEPMLTEVKTDGGIILSGETATEYLHGKVLAIGQGKLLANGGRMGIECKVGDLIIYGNMANNVEDSLNSKPVILITTEAFIAIIKE